MTVIGSTQHFKSFAPRELLIWDPSADDGLCPAVSLHMISLQPWWQWVCLSRVCDPWNWQRRVRTAESHTANSDGLSYEGVRRQCRGGLEGSLQFHRMSKIGFLLPVAHYRYSMRFQQRGHMRVVRKTEWHKMNPELEKWGEMERRNKQGWKGYMW